MSNLLNDLGKNLAVRLSREKSSCPSVEWSWENLAVTLSRENLAVCLLGNHVLDGLRREWLSPGVQVFGLRASILFTLSAP